MIEVSKIEVWGFEHAIRGMRNPMNSWEKSDSVFNEVYTEYENGVVVGSIRGRLGYNDLTLMQKLYKAGHPHRKYLRQIVVSMDINAPLYWWKEFDTYKVGTTANSCSTMHKIHAKEFTINDFSHEHIEELSDMDYNTGYQTWINLINFLNDMRSKYLDTKDKKYWWQMIQLLPTSYNQKRTVTMNYENIFNMLQYREGHKLDEWNDFCEILKDLPCVKQIMEVE